MIFYDIWFYAAHRLLHSSKYLAPYHKIHHQYDNDKEDKNKLTFWEAAQGHPIENILTNLGFFLPVVILSPPFTSSVIAYIIISFRGMMRHDYRAPEWISKHHLEHHSHPNYNFSSYPIDLLFGTVKK
jgi:sterol desaturase/sphingolipid hydroxylase (fatty acid hydroxylase superfamily)